MGNEEIYATEQFVNSRQVEVSFSVFDDDWYLIQQSETWKRLEKFLEEAEKNRSQMTLMEKVNLLETGQK